MSFNLLPDFSEAMEIVTDPMPVGSYNGRITSVEAGTSKEKQTPYLKITFTVFGAEGDLAKYNNWKVNGYFMLAGKGAGMTKMLLEAISHPAGEALTEEALLGKEAVVAIKYQKDQNTGETSAYPSIKALTKLA